MKKLITLLSAVLLMAFCFTAALPAFGKGHEPADPVPKSKPVIEKISMQTQITAITQEAPVMADIGDIATVSTDQDINYQAADLNVLTFNLERPERSVAVYYGSLHRSPAKGFDNNIRPPNKV